MSSILKISDAATLALHAMVYLAANTDRLVSTGEIAGVIKVSENHLSKVLQRLHRAGLVKSIRGPKGGFALEKPSDEVMLLEIFEVIEGQLTDSNCLLAIQICDGKKCIMGGLLDSINKQVKNHLSGTNLTELIDIFGGKKDG